MLNSSFLSICKHCISFMFCILNKFFARKIQNDFHFSFQWLQGNSPEELNRDCVETDLIVQINVVPTF